MKKIIYILFSVVAFVVSSSTFATKVGYVNVDKVLLSLPSFEKSREEIKAEFSPKQAEIIKSFKELEKRQKAFQKNKTTMLKSDADKESQTLLQLEQDLGQKAKMLKKEFDTKNEVMLQQIQTQINDAVKKIANKEKFDLILYGRIAYVDDSSEITSKVIKALKN